MKAGNFFKAVIFLNFFLLSNEVFSKEQDCIMPLYEVSYYLNAKQINDIMKNNNIKIVFEIGSWMGGGSTKHFGELLRTKGGSLFAIDHWKGNESQQSGEVNYSPILEQAYEQFLSNIIHYKLEDVVIPCRMDSKNLFKVLYEIPVDLIYIDGEHTTEAVLLDLLESFKFVKINPQCILCGDDWECDAVKEAVNQFTMEYGLRVKANGNFWRLYY